jgi:hypothetical protein
MAYIQENIDYSVTSVVNYLHPEFNLCTILWSRIKPQTMLKLYSIIVYITIQNNTLLNHNNN